VASPPEPFRKAIAPFHDGIVVGCECMHCWYWLGDTCRDDNIPFALGHAWGTSIAPSQATLCGTRRRAASRSCWSGAASPRNCASLYFPRFPY